MSDPIVSSSVDSTPLSERWPQVLRYPLQSGPLSTIVALTVAHLVAWVPGVGWFLDLIVWAAFFKYAFEVLRWSANGHEDAPEISLTVSDTIGRYAVLLLILVELLLLLVGIWYGAIAMLVVGLVVMFAVPAMVIILALEEGMARALNPFVWLILGSRLGRSYLLLVGFFFVALVVQSVLATALKLVLPGLLAVPIVYFIVNYLMIVNFHLIGWMIHEHRDALGYAGHLELMEAVPHTDPARAILDVARARAATGDISGAATLLREELANHPTSITLHDEYRHWLRQNDDKPTLAAHGKVVIPVLLAQEQTHRAIDVARECLLLEPTFQLERGEDVTQLARAAAESGHTQLALGLFAGFHKRFRNHVDIAGNYLIAAKLLAEKMNREMQARALLQQIKIAMPNDPVIPQVDAYIAFLDKLAATPTVKPAGTP